MGGSPPVRAGSVNSGHVIVISVGLIVPLVMVVIPVGTESAITERTGEGMVPSPTLFFALSLKYYGYPEAKTVVTV